MAEFDWKKALLDAFAEELDILGKSGKLEEEFKGEALKLFNHSREELIDMTRQSGLIIVQLLEKQFDLKDKLSTLKVTLESPAFKKKAFQKWKAGGRKEGFFGTMVFVVLPILAWVKFVILAE